MTEDQFSAWAQSHGFALNDLGHLLKAQPNGMLLRYRIIEGIAFHDSCYNVELGRWQMISCGSLLWLSVDDDNLLSGMTALIKEIEE